jgi:hypothetical protein
MTYYSKDDLDLMADNVRRECILVLTRADTEQVGAAKGWYYVAHEHAREMAKEYDVTKAQAAGVIAVLSPLTRWAQNIEAAEFVLSGDPDGAMMHCFTNNVAKAMRILRDDWTAISGPKVTAFAANILNPGQSQAVVIDTWMLRAFGLTQQDYGRKGVYDAVSKGIRLAAKAIGWKPHQVQALVWIVTRGKAE